MTRINVVPVEELCNKHLLAEYRELPRVFRLARPCSDAPKEYVLGAGHVKFFYDKLGFLARRFEMLVSELNLRGYNIAYDHLPATSLRAGRSLWGSYDPTPEALALNRARIAERLKEMEDRNAKK
jgi:deoxyribonuclease (pyrimidine dimer)